jgi:hypothetical protein
MSKNVATTYKNSKTSVTPKLLLLAMKLVKASSQVLSVSFLMVDDDGNEFGCPIGKGYNYSDRRYILENIHDYIGKIATFTYFERTKAGSYRHPLYKTLRDYE